MVRRYSESSREEEFVSLIPGTGWVAVFENGDEMPVVAFRMQRDGTTTGLVSIGKDLGDPSDDCYGFLEYECKSPVRKGVR